MSCQAGVHCCSVPGLEARSGASPGVILPVGCLSYLVHWDPGRLWESPLKDPERSKLLNKAGIILKVTVGCSGHLHLCVHLLSTLPATAAPVWAIAGPSGAPARDLLWPQHPPTGPNTCSLPHLQWGEYEEDPLEPGSQGALTVPGLLLQLLQSGEGAWHMLGRPSGHACGVGEGAFLFIRDP